MQLLRVNRATAEQARGVVIVIDVIRAFTVAGYAFAGGASGLWLVREATEAQALRARDPQALLAGEVGGRLIPGFDLNNSPALIQRADLRGKRLIQRTGAGTQGAVSVTNADVVLLCALTNAEATVRYALKLAQKGQGLITTLPTGEKDDFVYGNEDALCADYIEALIQGDHDAAQTILARGIPELRASGRFALWEEGHADFPADDIPAALALNRFDFAMVGQHQQWHSINYVDVQRMNVR
jgi:2-phosphosulfolactate phosphatase